MTFTYGPFDAGSGASLGENDYMDDLGPYLAGGDGIVGAPGSTALQVYGNSSGMQVFIRAGKAVIRGGKVKNDADVLIAIGANGSGLTRTDRVVIRHDRTANTVTPHVIVGTPGAAPPAITQTVGGTWDVLAAQVIVAPGAVTITSGNVLDERTFLPMHIPYCNTSVATPPADGSQGAFFYDQATNTAYTTNGTAWLPMGVVDSGWVPIPVDAGEHWIGTGGAYSTGIIVRKCINVVELLISVQATGAVGTPQICTLPAAYRSAIPRNFRLSPISDDFSYIGVDAQVTMLTSGVLNLFPGRDATDTNIPIYPGQLYGCQAVYIAG